MKSIKLFSVLIISMVSLILKCDGQYQNYKYTAIPAQYLHTPSTFAVYRAEEDSAKNKGYYLTYSLPKNFVKDGSVDYTKYVQSALDNFKTVIFPDFPILVNDSGLSLRSNSTIIFSPKSKLILKPTASSNYQILRIYNVDNVTVYFPVIVGDRDNHMGTTGEWGMGLYIVNATNIKLINPKVSNCWGDGIYLGKRGKENKNIQILYPELDYNRRNGLSIISVNGLYFKDPLITNTMGTLPMSGIDFEPNGNDDELQNIDIENPVTFNNARLGVLFNLKTFSGALPKSLSIKINNHLDDGSAYGLGYSFWPQTRVGDAPFNGEIDIVNPVYKNNIKGFNDYKSAKNGFNLHIKNVKVYKKDDSGRNIMDTDNMAAIDQFVHRN